MPIYLINPQNFIWESHLINCSMCINSFPSIKLSIYRLIYTMVITRISVNKYDQHLSTLISLRWRADERECSDVGITNWPLYACQVWRNTLNSQRMLVNIDLFCGDCNILLLYCSICWLICIPQTMLKKIRMIFHNCIQVHKEFKRIWKSAINDAGILMLLNEFLKFL